jgi:beta-lactam-binding protein with PASTA domain
LQNANLYSGTVTNFETTVVADEDKVRSQGTPAGQTVAKFSGVNFVVNVPNTTTTVPNFSNLTTTQADALRIQYELNIQLSASVYTSDTNLHMKIVPNSQSPSAGSVVPIFSTVTMSVYLPFPQYTVPNLIGQTPSSGAIDANFTWGSNQSGSNVFTQTTSDFGKVASQSPAAGTSATAQAINYGIYVDGRPVVPSVVGQTQSSAQTSISNVGLNYSTTFQNQTFSGQATAGTVASQTPSGGSRLASGGTVSIVVWNAYVPQPVAKTGTVTVGDNTYSGGNYLLDWTWQAHYKNISQQVQEFQPVACKPNW